MQRYAWTTTIFKQKILFKQRIMSSTNQPYIIMGEKSQHAAAVITTILTPITYYVFQIYQLIHKYI